MSFKASGRHQSVLKRFKKDLFGGDSSRPHPKASSRPSPERRRPPAVEEPLPAESFSQDISLTDPDYTSPCMYQEFYGFRRPPFNNTPDPKFFFLSSKHKEGLSRLEYAAQARKGFVLMTGEIGSGKTTVCRALIQRLHVSTKVALVTNTSMTSEELIRNICSEFNLETEGESKGQMITRLNHFLIQQLSLDKNVLLILDEAQNLDNSVLEEIRMLSNLETAQEKLIQIFLVGQPELRDKINAPELKQLRQRVALRYHMRPLDAEETKEYVNYRIDRAEAVAPPRFSEKAIEEIYQYTEGVPRVINTLCDNALIEGLSKEVFNINQGIVFDVIADLEGLSREEMGQGERVEGFLGKIRSAIVGRR
jgi:general secretion pathway protein A